MPSSNLKLVSALVLSFLTGFQAAAAPAATAPSADPLEIDVSSLEEAKSCLQVATPWNHLNAIDLALETRAKLRELDQKMHGKLQVVLIARDAKRDMSKTQTRTESNMALVDFARTNAATVEALKANYPRSSEKLDFFHVGIAVKTSTILDDGYNNWVMFHELKPCDSGNPKIYREGFAKFFLDDPKRFRSSIMVPQPAIQKRIREVLSTEMVDGRDLGDVLKAKQYDAIATAFQDDGRPEADRDQNSNQWVLEVVTAARQPRGTITNRDQVQSYLRQTGYLPSIIQLDGFMKLGMEVAGGIIDKFIGSVSTAHHPFARFQVFELVSVDSVEKYLIRQNALMVLHPEAQGRDAYHEQTVLDHRWNSSDFGSNTQIN